MTVAYPKTSACKDIVAAASNMVSEMTDVSEFRLNRRISALAVCESPVISVVLFFKIYLVELTDFGQGATQTELCRREESHVWS